MKLKIHHFLFAWYYNRVPKFFHQWPLFKSIDLLKQNYEHLEFVIKGKENLINRCIEREKQYMTRIRNLEFQIMGITQEQLEPFNKMFKVSMKGISKQQKEN